MTEELPETGITLSQLLDNKMLRMDNGFQRVPATSADVLSLTEGGVYVFIGVDEAPLYVGLTDNLGRRLSAHLNGWGSPDIYQYNRELLSIDYYTEPNVLHRDIYESYLIHTLRPRYNIGKTDKKKV